MAKEKLSEKESALIASALAEAATLRARGDASRPEPHETPRPAVRAPASASPSAPAATQTTAPGAAPGTAPAAVPAPTRAPAPAAFAGRIARMMEAERAETLKRKQRMKTAGTALIVAAALPVMAWALLKLLAQLAR